MCTHAFFSPHPPRPLPPSSLPSLLPSLSPFPSLLPSPSFSPSHSLPSPPLNPPVVRHERCRHDPDGELEVPPAPDEVGDARQDGDARAEEEGVEHPRQRPGGGADDFGDWAEGGRSDSNGGDKNE